MITAFNHSLILTLKFVVGMGRVVRVVFGRVVVRVGGEAARVARVVAPAVARRAVAACTTNG